MARYHRRSTPKLEHDAYEALAAQGRASRSGSSAALLRLADALDREHRQKVPGVQARDWGGTLNLTLDGEGDLLLEGWALKRKSDLFKKTYGLSVEVSPAGPERGVDREPRDEKLPGKLIAVEGLDGSGKSTQIHLVHQWLKSKGYGSSSRNGTARPWCKEATKKGKKRQLLTPTTFSLIHATDFADRYERQILPLLRAGYIVLCDRYIFTSFARDAVAGAATRLGSGGCTGSPGSPTSPSSSACPWRWPWGASWRGGPSSSTSRPAWTWA